MAAGPIKQLTADDARRTYRYLRIGIIGAVVLLAGAIGIERSKVDCFQESISAYYYTPVRAIFVGFLIAVGLGLIVYIGRSKLEDAALNFAGMLAPVVAVAPTTDVGPCWSIPPSPLPVQDGSLASWVAKNIDNNIHALLIAGFFGLGVMLIIFVWEQRKALLQQRQRGTWLSLGATFLVMLVGWWLIENWGDFNTLAHGWAALFLIGFLGVAIIAQAIYHWRERSKSYFWVYTVIAALMAVGGLLIWRTRIFDEHTVFALETYEIGFFAVYWIVQTKENWREKVIEAEPVGAEGSGGEEPRAEGR